MKSQPSPTSDDDEPFAQQSYDNVPPVDSGFAGMGRDPAEEFGGSRVTFQDPPSLPPAPSYTKPANDPYSENRGRRSGGGGRNKGGLIDKPKVKKVVKGLKKASKSHAKQASTLEDALKASKKKKSK